MRKNAFLGIGVSLVLSALAVASHDTEEAPRSSVPPSVSPRPTEAPSAEKGALFVKNLAKGSLAREAGLRIGDSVVAVNGHTFTSVEEFQKLVDATLKDPGRAAIGIVVRRGGALVEVNVTLGAAASRPKDLGVELGAAQARGRAPLFVVDIDSGSAAEKAGLRIGDRLLSVNGKEPKGKADLKDLWKAELADKKTRYLSLRVLRGGVERSVVLFVPELKGEEPGFVVSENARSAPPPPREGRRRRRWWRN